VAIRYRWDDFVLDLDGYRLERDGMPVPLEPKALNLLALIVQRPGHLYTKQEIFDAVWPATAVTDHALTRVVAQLRRALGDEAREARYIETVPTRGYRWVRPVEDAADPSEVRQPMAAPPAIAVVAAPVPAAIPSSSESEVVAEVPGRRRVFSGLAAALTAATAMFVTVVWLPPAASTSSPGGYGDTSVAGLRDPDKPLWPVQVTTHDGLDLQPAWSPQGDALAFVSDRTGSLEILVRALDGSAIETPLTRDGGQNLQPAWSPDGRSIAYHSSRRGGVWVVPARGGVPRQVVPRGSHPAWSPDGARLAFQSDEATDVTPSAFGAQSGSTIWVVDADGGNLRELTRSGSPIGGHAAPAWSADGRYLAFSVFEGGDSNGVWLYTLATGATHFLETGKGLFELAFAPDNSALYVAGGASLVVRLPFDADRGRVSGPREFIPVAGPPGVRGLSISPDGRRLAFAGLATSSQIWSVEVDGNGAARGAPRPLTTDTSLRKSLPVVSPDGERVAYVATTRGEQPNIWIVDRDGTSHAPLTVDDSPDFKPHWSPDGRQVLFMGTRRGRRGILAVDVSTRREVMRHDLADARQTPGVSLPGTLAEIRLSPSTRQLAFSLIEPPVGRRRLYVATLDPFAPRAVTDGTQSVGYPAWSPDERRLAVEIKDGSSVHAGVIDLATGALRQLTRDAGQHWVRSWSPDGRRIVMASLREGTWRLEWIDPDSSQSATVLPPQPPRIYVRYPDWSPRGDTIVFERGELRGNIWTLALREGR
jgi:Tol biopolymer transport system component/DNA-binding winged helix-turn-helix (wHTH) protein